MNKLFIIIFLSLPTLAEIVSPEQVITMRNKETGIKEYDYNIKNDSVAFDLSYVTNINPMKSSELSGFRGQVTYFSDEYNWIGYAALSSVLISQASDFSGDFDRDSESFDFQEIGIGLGKRTGLIKNFFKSQNVYDEYTAVATYSMADSNVLENSLSGYGLVATYGIFWRTSKTTHWGVKADYHLHSLEDDSDPDNIVELSASWISIALGLGLHF